MTSASFGKLRPRRATLGGLALALLLAGCGGGPPPATFDLSAPADGFTARGLRGQLLVAEPVAGQALDSERVVIRTTADSIAYLTGAQWSDRLPRLVQARLVQTFENARLLRSVGRTGGRLTADVVLTSEIRAFEIDTQASQAVIEISAKLVNEAAGRIVAAEVFSVRVPGSASSGAAAAAALDEALAQAMRRIVAWSAARV